MIQKLSLNGKESSNTRFLTIHYSKQKNIIQVLPFSVISINYNNGECSKTFSKPFQRMFILHSRVTKHTYKARQVISDTIKLVREVKIKSFIHKPFEIFLRSYYIAVTKWYFLIV